MPNRGELVILDRYIAETGKRGTALARIQTQREESAESAARFFGSEWCSTEYWWLYPP